METQQKELKEKVVVHAPVLRVALRASNIAGFKIDILHCVYNIGEELLPAFQRISSSFTCCYPELTQPLVSGTRIKEMFEDKRVVH